MELNGLKDNGNPLGIFAGILIGVVSFVVFASNLKETILVWTAPKIWIMIEIAELVKQHKGN